MFVEKLNVEQLMEFKEQLYPKSEGYESYFSIDSDGIFIIVQKENDRVSAELDDFEIEAPLRSVYDADSERIWKGFLYKIFGEEYKQAYIAKLTEDLK